MTCLTAQNDRLNLRFLKDMLAVGKKRARNDRKMAIYKSQILTSVCMSGV